MRIRATVLAVTFLFASIAVVVPGCSSPRTEPAASSQTPSAAASSPEPSAGSTDAGLVIDITIAAGTVTPTNATLTATVGTPITMRVSSDAGDELHVHSVPEHTFAVQAQPDQSFQFTVDVPGRVEIEVHHLEKTVAIVQVRP